MLFKSFKRSIDKHNVKIPHWDVNVVLLSLKVSPFEPAAEACRVSMTMKTLFVTTTSTGTSSKAHSELLTQRRGKR